MMTRDTHARIYQQELPRRLCRDLENIASSQGIHWRQLLVDCLRRYLGDWDGRQLLDLEDVPADEHNIRLYLWIPYEKCDELEQLLKSRGIQLQELTREALRTKGPGGEEYSQPETSSANQR
ncbi:MAG: hypothetical protein JRJ12_16165 [Deltaproteobacteria bacterium]|nr:hypothetical protein [Deltaproteobacteria bacterium]MBW2072607.1 hypothetical protein [Deltaproteobacteria bacterium]